MVFPLWPTWACFTPKTQFWVRLHTHWRLILYGILLLWHMSACWHRWNQIPLNTHVFLFVKHELWVLKRTVSHEPSDLQPSLVALVQTGLASWSIISKKITVAYLHTSTVHLISDPSISSEREQLNQVRRWKRVTSTANQVRPQAINKDDRRILLKKWWSRDNL